MQIEIYPNYEFEMTVRCNSEQYRVLSCASEVIVAGRLTLTIELEAAAATSSYEESLAVSEYEVGYRDGLTDGRLEAEHGPDQQAAVGNCGGFVTTRCSVCGTEESRPHDPGVEFYNK